MHSQICYINNATMHYYKIRRKKAIKEIEGSEENYKLYIIKKL